MSSPRRKPDWLKVELPSGDGYFGLVRLLKRYGLHTVCQEANCPNIAECFSKKTATFLILGDTCTRSCRYCNVKHGKPREVDAAEPERVAGAVKKLGLHYIVVTSVTRDDLKDGGASVFAETIGGIRGASPGCKIEVLIPDFKGDMRALQTVLDAKPDVLGHNLEVVKRLFPKARPRGDYERSLDLLRTAKEAGAVTKSGLMAGLGESNEEMLEAMGDLCSVTDIITIGQYLQPTTGHLPVARYYPPAEFEKLKAAGLEMGFKHVEAGPLVRSSYHASEYGARQNRD